MSSDSSKFYESVNGAVSIEGEVTKNYQKHMEAHGPLDSNDGPRHHPLTPVRVVRGVLCILVLVSTAFMILVYLAPVLAGILRLFSIHYSRKAVSFVFGTWLSLWPFFFEKINQTKVIFAGDVLPARERALLLANHRTEVDWMYLWDLALRKGRLGYIKYILKSSLMQLPIFGWGFHILEFISVERKWELDESNMYHMLSTFSDPQDPLWLALFPEGTDFSEQKCIKGQQYATKNGLPILKNLLLPKTKGFHACLEVLRGSLDAVYDITIAYKHRCPTFLDNAFGVDPSEVHIHVLRIPITDIPTEEEEAAAWLMKAFEQKDQLLSDFNSHGHFPNQGTEGGLSTLRGMVNFTMIISLTFIFIYLTFYSKWCKIYVALSCAYLITVTTFNIRPSPNVGFMKAVFDQVLSE